MVAKTKLVPYTQDGGREFEDRRPENSLGSPSEMGAFSIAGQSTRRSDAPRLMHIETWDYQNHRRALPVNEGKGEATSGSLYLFIKWANETLGIHALHHEKVGRLGKPSGDIILVTMVH